jgi:hypothetical protein
MLLIIRLQLLAFFENEADNDEQEAHLPGQSLINLGVAATVLFSVLAHGISTVPGIGWYDRQLKSVRANAPEFQETVVSPP